MNQLIVKIVKTEQYDASTQTIVWRDAIPNRWTNVYGKLIVGDRGYFIGQGDVYSGILKSIQPNQSLTFENTEVFNLSADDFLSIDAVHPEQNAAVKAHFNPMLSESPIDYDVFKAEVANKNYVHFWIVKDTDLDLTTFKQNDRIATIDNDMVFCRFGIVRNGSFEELQAAKELFNVKGMSIYDAIDLFEKIKKADSKKSKNAELLKRVEKHLVKNNTFEFSSFNGYYNVIHNRRAYLYSNVSKQQFFVGGAYWSGSDPKDQTKRFVQDGIWENGYDDKFTDIVNNIPVGSMIAIKTTNKQYDEMEIKAIGEVTANHGDGQTLDVTWEEDFVPFTLDFSGGYWDTIKRVTNQEHIKKIFFQEIEIGEPVVSGDGSDKPHPLNTILYGPPGTGKTYNTIDTAINIITGSPKKHKENKIEFDNFRKEGRIAFVTFHQNYTYEDFVVGLKPDIANDSLKFIKNKGIFYNMVKDAEIAYNSAKSKGINPLRYVLIIDEINRANISRVFGELITLLEDDKRLDAENSLTVTLPNGEEFSVPPNLYIIGTMNTADKSISLIDVALRRRFEFIGKYPDYKVLEEEKPERVSFLKELNKNIYKKRKSADYLIGHAYLLRNDEIENIIKNKIIPLLMEYFSGHTDEVSAAFINTGYTATYGNEIYNWVIVPNK